MRKGAVKSASDAISQGPFSAEEKLALYKAFADYTELGEEADIPEFSGYAAALFALLKIIGKPSGRSSSRRTSEMVMEEMMTAETSGGDVKREAPKTEKREETEKNQKKENIKENSNPRENGLSLGYTENISNTREQNLGDERVLGVQGEEGAKNPVQTTSTPENPVPFVDRLPERFQTADVRAKWEEWETYRRKRKKKISEEAFKLMLSKMEMMATPQELVSSIEASIANDWQGLFPPRQKVNGGTYSNGGELPLAFPTYLPPPEQRQRGF